MKLRGTFDLLFSIQRKRVNLKFSEIIKGNGPSNAPYSEVRLLIQYV